MIPGRALVARALALVTLAALSAPVRNASAEPRPEQSEPPTPALIERAVARGELGRAAADMYLVAALRGERVPPEYENETPFRGTLILLELHRRLERLHPGPQRRLLRQLLHPAAGVGMDQCGDTSNAPLPNTIESAHFYIEYNAALLGGGLTIDTYISTLETAWSKEVDQFGWAAPPPFPPNPAPNNKYPVRIDNLGPALYGFVSNFGTHAGRVGNNPATSWNEGDADASCMVLNSNYDPFPGTPIQALQATAAHEFSHSIQFGWGALAGPNVPDAVFIEGSATWIEDEVFDESNDNYNYLWPQFDDDMGQYIDTFLESPYEYWVTWRGMSEPYGTGVPGGGEDVQQRFWELTSKNEASNLEAMDRALEAEGTSLGVAFHAYAIAVKFAKACGGGYQHPHCLEEGPAYAAHVPPGQAIPIGVPAAHGSVGMNATHQGQIPDNYSINWIVLPGNTRFQAILKNPTSAGRFRASIACDTGSGLVISPFDAVVDAGETAYVREYNPCPAPIAVITNVTQTAPNPPFSEQRQYSLTITPPAERTNLSVSGRVSSNRVIAKGKLTPPGTGGRVEVALFRKAGGWKEVKTRMVSVGGGGTFRSRFKEPDATRCRLEAEFAGDDLHLRSSAKQTFRC